MILLRLFYEFFKTGLFSVGGGMATIPFLQHMGEATGWFTNQELTTMIAFSVFTVADNLSPDSFPAISWPSLLLAVAVFVGMKWTPLKKLHPIVFILASAVAGILLQL